MTVATTQSAALFLNVVSGTPTNCPFPMYTEEEVQVVYGQASVAAVLNTDYTVQLSTDFSTFTVTPLDALLTKINALIGADTSGEEINYITVRRALSNLSNIAPTTAGYTTFLADEISRLWLGLNDLNEVLYRSPSLPPMELGQTEGPQFFPNVASRANKAVIFDADGNFTISTENFEEVMASLVSSLAAVTTGLDQIAADVTAAGAYATEAAQSVLALSASSNTPQNIVGSGMLTFATQVGKSFNPPCYVTIGSMLSPTNAMTMLVTAYAAGSLTGNIVGSSGGGLHSDWAIEISGGPGVQGIQGPPGAAGAGTGDVVAANAGSEYVGAAATFRGHIGLDTMATQPASGVTITGGTISGITALPIASGGTGQGTALGAFNALKQQGTTAFQGTLQLATNAQAVTGTSTALVVTPAGVAAAIAAGGVSGSVVQRAYAESTATTSFSNPLPIDNTIPQNGEGDIVLTLNITPKNTTNKLRISALVNGSLTNTSGVFMGVVILANGTCKNARCVFENAGALSYSPMVLENAVEYVPGAATQQTIDVVVGNTGGAPFQINSLASTRVFGGAARCTLIVEEIVP